jgi:uncharacterized OB-fold protein
MNYLNLLKARRQSGKIPTLEQRQWTTEQQMRITQGRCVQCGERPAGPDSYICIDCQANDTLEDIRGEIQALRKQLLREQHR